jgi:hypothetical protein
MSLPFSQKLGKLQGEDWLLDSAHILRKGLSPGAG